MNQDMYNILALIARYFFAALMVLIVIRGWRMTIRDNRRAKWLREQSPETSAVGQLIINPGNKRRQLVSITSEGVLGSSRKADIRVKYKDILPLHAHIEAREGALLVRPLGQGRLALGDGEPSTEPLVARDGDVIRIGKQRLLVVLFEAAAPSFADELEDEPRGSEHDTEFDGIWDDPNQASWNEPSQPQRGSKQASWNEPNQPQRGNKQASWDVPNQPQRGNKQTSWNEPNQPKRGRGKAQQDQFWDEMEQQSARGGRAKQPASPAKPAASTKANKPAASKGSKQPTATKTTKQSTKTKRIDPDYDEFFDEDKLWQNDER